MCWIEGGNTTSVYRPFFNVRWQLPCLLYFVMDSTIPQSRTSALHRHGFSANWRRNRRSINQLPQYSIKVPFHLSLHDDKNDDDTPRKFGQQYLPAYNCEGYRLLEDNLLIIYEVINRKERQALYVYHRQFHSTKRLSNICFRWKTV